MKNKNKDDKEGYSLLYDEKFIEVTDDWYPCFPDNKVRVEMFLNKYKNDKFVRICVWGADDYGLELDWTGNKLTTYADLEYHYKRIKKYIYDRIPNPVNKEWFFEHGFYQA